MQMATPAATTATSEIEIKTLPAQDYLGQRFTSRLATVGRDVQSSFMRLYNRIEEAHSRPAGPPFLIASEPNEGSIEIEVGAPCIPVPESRDGFHVGHLDAGNAAVLLYRGPYDRIGTAYEELFAWIGTHGYSPRGDAREIYLNGPGEVVDPTDYLTDVVVPIR